MEESYRTLAAATVYQAVKEWRAMIRRRLRTLEPCVVDAAAAQMEGLRTFFCSPWCDLLLCGAGEGEELLRRLENEYRESRLWRQMHEAQSKLQGRQPDAQS